MVKWLLWGVAALLVGVVLGAATGLLRRRPEPEVTSYVPPTPASGPTAVGPHRRVLRVPPAS